MWSWSWSWSLSSLSGHQGELQICFISVLSLREVVFSLRLTDDIILPQQRAAVVHAAVPLTGQWTRRGWSSPPGGAEYPFLAEKCQRFPYGAQSRC